MNLSKSFAVAVLTGVFCSQANAQFPTPQFPEPSTTFTQQQEATMTSQTNSKLPGGFASQLPTDYVEIQGRPVFIVPVGVNNDATETYSLVTDYYSTDSQGNPFHMVRDVNEFSVLSDHRGRSRYFIEIAPFEDSAPVPSGAEDSFLAGHAIGIQEIRVWIPISLMDAGARLSSMITAGTITVADLEPLASRVSGALTQTITRAPGSTDWTVSTGESVSTMTSQIEVMHANHTSTSQDFDDCMSDCFSSVSWVVALTFTACSGIGITACLAGGGPAVLACASPIIKTCGWVALGGESAGIIACLIKCVQDAIG